MYLVLNLQVDKCDRKFIATYYVFIMMCMFSFVNFSYVYIFIKTLLQDD